MAGIGKKIKEAATNAAKGKRSGDKKGKLRRRLGERRGQGHEGRQEPSEVGEAVLGRGPTGSRPFLLPLFTGALRRF